MRATYAVIWREGEQVQGTGSLELLRHALRLDGVRGNERAVLDIPYAELAGLRVGHGREDRVAGNTALVLERRSAPAVRIASFGQPNLISEIAEQVAAIELGGAPVRRTAVVVPILPGTHEQARALLAGGPPFDPGDVGLERHQVFLTPDEVVFLFESQLGEPSLEALLAEPALVEAAAAWQDVLAGPPRIADSVYSWTRIGAGFDPALASPEF
jgi:hypothetical protein